MATKRISLGRAILEIDTDLDPFLKGMDEAGGRVKKFGKESDLLTTSLTALGGAFIGQKLLQFGAAVLDTAGSLSDLHERTGVSIEGLQKFGIIAEQSGSSIDAVATAIFQMGKRLAGGDDNATDALEQLGLSFDELRAMRPEEAFTAIGSALGSLEDPMKRAELGAKIFGRSVDELMPTFVNLTKETGSYIALSAQQVSALDAIGDALTRTRKSVIPLTVSMIDSIFQISKATEAWKSFFGVVNPDEQSAAYQRLTESMKTNAKAVADRAAVAKHGAEFEIEVKKAEVELTKALADKEKKMKEVQAQAEKTQKANEAFRASVVNLTSSAVGAAQGFGAYGMLMPDLSAQTLKFADATIYLAGAFDDAKLSTEELGTSGRHLGAAMQEAQEKIATLPTVVSQYGEEIREAAAATETLTMKLTDGLMKALEGLPDLLIKSFTGGGGVAGALKAFGVQLAEAVIGPLIEKMTQASKMAVGFGASIAGAVGGKVGGGGGAMVGGLASTVGGAALAGTAMGGAAAAGSIAATVALGAATAGIGIAAVGAFYGLKKLWSMAGASKEEKQARDTIAQFTQGIVASASAAQKAEAATAGWAGADSLIVIRDGYLAAGHSAEEAEAMVAKLWDSSQNGGKDTLAIIEQINSVMVEGTEKADELAKAAAEASAAQQEAEAEAEAAREARLDEFQSRIDEMISRRDELIKSVEKEAPERVMGVIEKAQRAEIEALDKQIADQKVKMSIAADEMAADITDALSKLKFKVRLEGEWHLPPLPHVEGVTPMAAGGFGHVTKPTLFLAGEGGPEDFAFSGGNKKFGKGGGDGDGMAAVVAEVAALRRDFQFNIPNWLAKAQVSQQAKG